MQLATDYQRPAISFADMRAFLAIGWGGRGIAVADAWRALNKKHFRNKLEPLPIILVNTSPFGRWLGCTYCNTHARRAHLIQLTVPSQHDTLVADRGTLLHEMIHQSLTETGRSPKHEHQPWCEEIMRLHFAITGKPIWAAPQTIAKRRDPVTRARRSVRLQTADPTTGAASLGREQIATWPHSVRLALGAL